MALTASHTAAVKLTEVQVPNDRLLAGPVHDVLKQFGGGAGGLTTSALAVGLAARAAQLIAWQADVRPDLRSVSDQFDAELDELRSDLLTASASEDAVDVPPNLTAAALRQRANSLAARVTRSL